MVCCPVSEMRRVNCCTRPCVPQPLQMCTPGKSPYWMTGIGRFLFSNACSFLMNDEEKSDILSFLVVKHLLYIIQLWLYQDGPDPISWVPQSLQINEEAVLIGGDTRQVSIGQVSTIEASVTEVG